MGIVVDDAIVVVENVERNLRLGLSPREASRRTMDEVGGALVAIALTLIAVFVPAAFLSGISGQFFRQFAVTIAAATAISCLVSLTLSPALCALLFKPHEAHPKRASLPVRAVQGFFNGFNYAFDKLSGGYGAMTKRLVRVAVLVLVVYAGLIALTGWQFSRAPTGFIPQQEPRLSDHRAAIAAGLFSGPDGCCREKGDRHHPGDAGCRACRAVLRLRCRDLHQCAQCRRHLRAAEAVPRTGGAGA